MIDSTNSRSRQFRLTLALAAFLLCAGRFQASAQGIIYGTFPATPLPILEGPLGLYDVQGYRLVSFEYSQTIYYNLSLGREKSTNLIFNSGADFCITGKTSNDQFLAIRQGPSPWYTPWVVPLSAGAEISSDSGDYEWMSETSVLTASRASDTEGTTFLTMGYFTRVESGYIGCRFQENGLTYYGWIRVGAPFEGLNGGWLYDYAYETAPDTPILAGQTTCTPIKISPVSHASYVRLDWPSTVGNTFQVQYKEQLDATNWSNMDFAVTATGTNTTINLPKKSSACFYRVVQIVMDQ